MATEGHSDAILDPAVLLNFLVVDRVGLLAKHPSYRFVLTDHVRSEVRAHYVEQVARLDDALEHSLFEVAAVDALNPAFVQLVLEARLGIAECAAIALAIQRKCPLVTDDRRVCKTARRLRKTMLLESTETTMIALIKANTITLAAADAIKLSWEREHRFRLGFQSFALLLAPSASQ